MKADITELFAINSSKQIDRMRTTPADINDIDAVPFLSRSASDNGVGGYVQPLPDFLNPGGVITVALDGSTGSTFYQRHTFMSGQNIWVLSPLESMFESFSAEVAIYFVASIRKAVAAYTYNLSLTKTRLLKIKLVAPPLTSSGRVDVKAIEAKMRSLRGADQFGSIQDERFQTV